MYENRRAFPSEMPHVYFWQKKQTEAKPRFRRNSLCCVPWPSFQRPFTKEAGWRLTFHLAAWLGWSSSSGYPATPRAPAVARTQLAAGGRFLARGVPRIRCRVGADRKGPEPATCWCAGLQRRWLAAALKDAHGGAQEVPRLHPLWMSNWRTPIGWKWRISNLSQNVHFRRIWMREYYHIGWRAGESGRLSCKVKVKEVCLKLSKIWNFGSRFRDHSHE